MARNHTKLEAVNEMLEEVGVYPVAALDTGGSSDAADAERCLDRWNKRIQARGWHENTETDVEYGVADVTKVAVAISGDGDWTAATKILNKTAAFASYTWASGDQIYVSAGTGVTVGWYEIASRTDDDNIVLKDSIASSDQTDVSTTLIGWDDAITVAADILRIDSDQGSTHKDVTLRDDKLYSRDDNTFTFDGSVDVTLSRLLLFADLTVELQDYILSEALIEFQNRKVGSATADARLRDARDRAMLQAERKDAENSDANVLDTDTALRIRGGSDVQHYGR